MSPKFSIDEKQQKQGDALKQRFIDCVQKEKLEFLKNADDFYDRSDRSRDSYIKFANDIINAVDHVLTTDNWEESLFLRNTIKPLKQVREEAAQLLQQLTGGDTEMADIADVPLKEDEMKLYITIFQSGGHNLKSWELQLRSIGAYLHGRPVYSKEEDAQKVLRLKVSSSTDAYIVVVVPKTAIYNDPFAPPRSDRHGNTLVALKSGIVKPEHIIEFVHQGQRYKWRDGKLIQR